MSDGVYARLTQAMVDGASTFTTATALLSAAVASYALF